MARFDTSGLDDLVNDMRRLEQDTGEVAEAMVMAAAQIIQRCWQRSITEHGLIDTGSMLQSIGFPKTPTKFSDSLGIDIYPQGKDKKGVRNAEKAFILHYGTRRRPALYWVDDADQYAEIEIPEVLEEMWGRYLETGRIPDVSEIASALSGANATKTTKV